MEDGAGESEEDEAAAEAALSMVLRAFLVRDEWRTFIRSSRPGWSADVCTYSRSTAIRLILHLYSRLSWLSVQAGSSGHAKSLSAL